MDLLFRHTSSTILFKTDSVLELLGKSLPLAPHSLRSVVGSNNNSNSGASAGEQSATDEQSAQVDISLLPLLLSSFLLPGHTEKVVYILEVLEGCA